MATPLPHINVIRMLTVTLLAFYTFVGMSQESVSPCYETDGMGFCCTNGTNKYTRALYGSTTDYRIETSDRPIFGVYTKKAKRNIRFFICDGKGDVPLDSLYCKSYYSEGKRIYSVAGLILTVMPTVSSEGCFFVFSAINSGNRTHLKTVISNVNNPKMKRSGDMGVDAPDAFDPAKEIKEYYFNTVPKGVLYIKLNATDSLSVSDEDNFTSAERLYSSISTIKVCSPDSTINAAIAALPYAANGLWDGRTFRHGAVGWRTELPGWRGAYVGDVLGWNDRAKSHFSYYANEQIKDVPPVYPHPTQDTTKNLARAAKVWGTQMYSDGYITSNRKLNHYDMNLVYIDEMLWHFQYDADTTYLRKMWQTIKSSLEWEKRNFDPDGDHLYDAYACIWASDALYYNGGAVTHSSAYNYRANLLAARIAEIIGEDAEPYRQEADSILAAMNKTLWDDSLGHWAEYKDLMGLKRLHTDAALWSYYTPIDEGIIKPYDLSDLDKLAITTRWGGKIYRTSDWQPYAWSINNVVATENYHLALAFFELGEKQRGYELLRNTILDNMVYGHSPGNYGQLLTEDEHRGECYRDFGDCIGIASRAIIQGLFGIVPDALNGRCYIRPAFPDSWDSVSISLPYISYKYKRGTGVYNVRQNFPQHLDIIIEAPHLITAKTPDRKAVTQQLPYTLLSHWQDGLKAVDMSKFYNDRAYRMYGKKYLSPRPNVTTLEIPVQGAGDWCSTDYKPTITDSSEVVFTSFWDNYPDSITVPVKAKANAVEFELFGTTNWMQSHIENGSITVNYSNGSREVLNLVNPTNWLPQDKSVFLLLQTDKSKRIESVTLRTLSNDVIIGVKRIAIKK